MDSLQNSVYDNHNYYSSADQLLGINSITTEPFPYIDPIKTAEKFTNSDYEAPPKLDDYEQLHPINISDNVQYDYPLSISNSVGSMQSSISPVGQALSEDEQIYEDPGHIKEEIYQWFKQRNICKLNKSSVRYVYKQGIVHVCS